MTCKFVTLFYMIFSFVGFDSKDYTCGTVFHVCGKLFTSVVGPRVRLV
jgi:hypothetical protein